MAMQIIYGKMKGQEIVFPESCRKVNVTEALEPICDEFFKKETFIEDEEEIYYKVATKDQVRAIVTQADKEIEELLAKLKKTRGTEAREELLSNLYDFSLLKTTIIEMLLTDDVNVLAMI